MDRDDARAAATAQVRELRTKSYDQLRARLLDQQETVEVLGPSGAKYQVECQAVIDGPGDVLRVIVSVDNGGFSAFAPLSADFLVSP